MISNSVARSGQEVWVKKDFNKIDSVKKVWGAEVYSLVTGDPGALKKVFDILPTVISDVMKDFDIIDFPRLLSEISEILSPHLDGIKEDIFRKVLG